MGAKEMTTRGVPGIYMVRSERSKTVGFFESYSIDARLRKMKSDYKRGRILSFLDKMGVRYSGDVVFEKVEECPPEIFGIRIRRLAEAWIADGYEVYGWTGESGEKREEAEPWGPCGRLKEIAGEYGLSDEYVNGVLDRLAGKLEERRKPGLAPTGGSGD